MPAFAGIFCFPRNIILAYRQISANIFISYINTAEEKMTEHEKAAVSYLPGRLADVAVRTAGKYGEPINEIRLRLGRPMSLTIGNGTVQKNADCGVICTAEEIRESLLKLCGDSLYSHACSIREGFIHVEGGIRVGVCGHAVLDGERMTAVRDITSLNIRIPHRAAGVADKLYSLALNSAGVLIYSPPGMGKTTLLRELIPLLAGGAAPHRVAVIDTRYELTGCGNDSGLVDTFAGYPRYAGIISAVRSMAPEYIICDEISAEEDVKALEAAHFAGISICASIHAHDYSELCRIPYFKRLIASGAFDYTYGITGTGSIINQISKNEASEE